MKKLITPSLLTLSLFLAEGAHATGGGLLKQAGQVGKIVKMVQGNKKGKTGTTAGSTGTAGTSAGTGATAHKLQKTVTQHQGVRSAFQKAARNLNIKHSTEFERLDVATHKTELKTKLAELMKQRSNDLPGKTKLEQTETIDRLGADFDSFVAGQPAEISGFVNTYLAEMKQLTTDYKAKGLSSFDLAQIENMHIATKKQNDGFYIEKICKKYQRMLTEGRADLVAPVGAKPKASQGVVGKLKSLIKK